MPCSIDGSDYHLVAASPALRLDPGRLHGGGLTDPTRRFNRRPCRLTDASAKTNGLPRTCPCRLCFGLRHSPLGEQYSSGVGKLAALVHLMAVPWFELLSFARVAFMDVGVRYSTDACRLACRSDFWVTLAVCMHAASVAAPRPTASRRMIFPARAAEASGASGQVRLVLTSTHEVPEQPMVAMLQSPTRAPARAEIQHGNGGIESGRKRGRT